MTPEIKKALDLALEALQSDLAGQVKKGPLAIAAVKKAQTQTVQEPVAWTGCGECDCSFPCHGGRTACIRNVESECASPSMTSGERTEYEARIKRLGEALTLQYESGERLAARIMELEEATHGITKGQP